MSADRCIVCRATVIAIVIAILTAPHGGSLAASTQSIAPTAAIGAVDTIGMTDGSLPVYVATSAGLYRSAAPDLSRWSKQNANAEITSISPNPASPNSLVFAAAGALYRSTDGGRSDTQVVSCFSGYVARSYQAPAIVYAASHVSPCTKIAALYESVDDGRTWTTVYTDTTSLDDVVIDATNPAHLLIPQTFVDNAGAPVAGTLWQSFFPRAVR